MKTGNKDHQVNQHENDVKLYLDTAFKPFTGLS